MKTMNHIPSSLDGTVKEIFVKNGQIISPGEKIFLINPLWHEFPVNSYPKGLKNIP